MEEITKLVLNIFDSNGIKIKSIETTKLLGILPTFGDKVILDGIVATVQERIISYKDKTIFIVLKSN